MSTSPFSFGVPPNVATRKIQAILTINESIEEMICATWALEPGKPFYLPNGQRCVLETIVIHFGKGTPCPIRVMLKNKLYSDQDPCQKFSVNGYFGYAHYPQVEIKVPGLRGRCALYHVRLPLQGGEFLSVDSKTGGRRFLSGTLIRPMV